MAQAVAEHGYGATTVAHVVALAGVSRKTFYEHFGGKEDCFLALYDTGIAYVLGRIVEVVGDEALARDPHARVLAGLETFLGVLAEEPAFSRAIIVEVHAAGPERCATGAPCWRPSPSATRRSTASCARPTRRSRRFQHDAALALVGAIPSSSRCASRTGNPPSSQELTESLADFTGATWPPSPASAAAGTIRMYGRGDSQPSG